MKSALAMWALVVVLVLSGCFAGTRDRVVEKASDKWCGLTEEEKVVVAERRNYSEQFVTYLESRCEA